MKTYPSKIFLVLILLIFCCAKTDSWGKEPEAFQHFISVSGNKLMDGNETFRFVSFNVPTLNYNEDEFGFEKTQPYSLPTDFEIRDVMATISQLGGKVIRMYTIPVKMKNAPDNTPTYVESPNVFNEEAFKTMDKVLALANEYQIRVIFSLLNNWQWMGGRPQYASMRGKKEMDFYTDSQIISDFKKTIEHVVTRTNTITGTKYCDDKAIMCWETGNELQCPDEWTATICRYIKSLDKNHLVMDGFFATGNIPVKESSVLEGSIDILSSHHYEQDPKDFETNVTKNLDIIKGRKPYLIGEFGFVGTPAMEYCIDKVINTKEISGILIWGLRGHRENGGFYWHSEPLGYGRYKAYHWPGFASGREYDEMDMLSMLRKKAYAIDNKPAPDLSAPVAPEMLPINQVSQISWKGSVGASSYDVYRSEISSGTWQLVGYNISDTDLQYAPLFNDESATIGKTYIYRVIAKNKWGNSKPSAPSNAIDVENLALIDNMDNFGKLYFASANISVETANDRMFKEDMFRIRCVPGSELVYYVPGKITGINIFSFCTEDTINLQLEQSSDNQTYTPLVLECKSFNNGKGDYGYWVPIEYSSDEKRNASYIRIKAVNETQISRVEIMYVN